MHACALRADGTVRCWGDDRHGQASPPDERFTAISAGLYHTCGLRADGTARCWGSRAPVPGFATEVLPDDPRFPLRALVAGEGGTCGILAGGEVEDPHVGALSDVICWGTEPRYQEHFSGYTGVPTQALALGTGFGCSLSAGAVTCFGDGSEEERAERTWPARAPGWTDVRAIAAGAYHVCALRADGSIGCWGGDGWGDGGTIFAGQTRAPAGRFIAVRAGGGTSCGLRPDGTAVCWGDLPAPEGRFRRIDVDTEQVCGVTRSGAVRCVDEVGNTEEITP